MVDNYMLISVLISQWYSLKIFVKHFFYITGSSWALKTASWLISTTSSNVADQNIMILKIFRSNMFVLKFWQCKVVVWCERETADAILNTERKNYFNCFLCILWTNWCHIATIVFLQSLIVHSALKATKQGDTYWSIASWEKALQLLICI